MNTPDTEWGAKKKAMRALLKNTDMTDFDMYAVDLIIDNLLTSRDTYWKERVLDWIETNESYDEFPEPHVFANDLREFITNEDNLK